MEVIAAVLEAGFGTLCLRFNDLGGLKLRLVHEGRPRQRVRPRFPYAGLLFGLILTKVTTALHGVFKRANCSIQENENRNHFRVAEKASVKLLDIQLVTSLQVNPSSR